MPLKLINQLIILFEQRIKKKPWWSKTLALSFSPLFSLSYHPSLSAKALDKRSRQHLLSTQRLWIKVSAGQPILVCPCVGVYRTLRIWVCHNFLWSTQHVLLWQIGGKSSFSSCSTGEYLQDLFKIAGNILVQFPSSLFFKSPYIYIYKRERERARNKKREREKGREG